MAFKEWETINHAYVSSGHSPEDIWHLLSGLGYVKQSNPDALQLELDTFGVDDARSLYEWSINKPFGAGRKVAVVRALSVTVEAQNALLKLFEEPSPATHFFLLVPSVGMLLPTLLSRVHVLSGSEHGKKSKAEDFLKGSISERFRIISPITKAKDRDRARALLRDLAALSRSEEVLQAEKWLSGRSPSVKMILEYLAVTVVNSKHV